MAKYSNLIRKLHRVAALTVPIPLFFIITTGILLQIKNWIPWIQPEAKVGSSIKSTYKLTDFLEISRSIPVVQVTNWKDIRVIDIRPSIGIARIRTQSKYEISVDLKDLHILQVAPRRTDTLIELHNGFFFGDYGKYGVYLPSSVLLLILLITGIFILIQRYKHFFKLPTSLFYQKTPPSIRKDSL